MRIAVLGAGIAASSITYDLADDEVSPEVEEVLVADIVEEKARRVAEGASKFTSKKEVRHARVDASKVEEVSSLIRGYDVVINGVIYTYIPQVMRAALKAGVHYVDLGSDVETVLKQYEMDDDFRRAGLIAVPGMGGSPGTINVAGKYAISLLDRVERLLLREGWVDLTPYEGLGVPLPVPYSLETILDELEDPVEVWEDGKIVKVPAFSGREVMEFPQPIGEVELYYVEHPEVFTLARHYQEKGLKFVDYKLSFPRELYLKYRLLYELGLTKQVKPKGCERTFRDLLKDRVEATLEGKEFKVIDYDVMRAIAEGERSGNKARVVVDVFTGWHIKWELSAQSTLVGMPASILAQWIAKGVIEEKGVRDPEEVVDPLPFFDELKKRGSRVTVTLEELT